MKHLLLFSLVVLSACSNNASTTQKSEAKDTTTVRNPEKEEEADIRPYYPMDAERTDIQLNDTAKFYTVSEICAVSIFPDTSWINEQQRSMPESDWNTVADDNSFYISQGEDSLEKINIPVQYRMNDKQYIRFIKKDKSEFIIDKSKMKDKWGLILFNGKDDPVFWWGDDIGIAVREIYSR